jgi:hypothetical protein
MYPAKCKAKGSSLPLIFRRGTATSAAEVCVQVFSSLLLSLPSSRVANLVIVGLSKMKKKGKMRRRRTTMRKKRRTTTTPSDPTAATLPFWCLMPKGE